ncbi:MAG TPA: OsmC family protein [Devosia sp.]|nr:OsmC family protein [Devosia sp.]
MNAAELRAIQAPLKDRFRADPAAALITLHAIGRLEGSGITCTIERSPGEAVAGLHPATGGTGAELCSGDMLLEALVACAGVTLRSVATVMEIPIRSGRLLAEGDIDFRGTLGVSRETPVGFLAIRLRIELDTDAPQEALDRLLKLTERYCVVSQSLKVAPAMSIARA